MNDITAKIADIIPLDRVISTDEVNQSLSILSSKKILTALTPGVICHCVVYPHTLAELTTVIKLANENNWQVLPCGSGTKLHWGGLVSETTIIISTLYLNRVIEQATEDLTVTVETGIKLTDLQSLLAKSGQFIAIDPAYSNYATIGGIINTADTGSLRQRYGGVRDMLLGVSLLRSDGQVAKAGGRVVKNVAGYDLMKLYTGSYGTLGILTQATFRVYPLPESSTTVILQGDLDSLNQAKNTILTTALTPTALDVISAQLSNDINLGNNITLIARFQTLPDSAKLQSEKVLNMGQELGLKGILYTGNDELQLWEKLKYEHWAIARSARYANAHSDSITCKIGILPNQSIKLCQQLTTGQGLIHSGKGNGTISVNTIEDVNRLRKFCQTQGGFLSILEAPVNVKQKLDILGYNGNGLELMKKIKKQFDPKNMFSPNRLFS
ncbi:MAG TPA: FAD-binding oxidoreductase [Allocoleopsis sp.]